MKTHVVLLLVILGATVPAANAVMAAADNPKAADNPSAYSDRDRMKSSGDEKKQLE